MEDLSILGNDWVFFGKLFGVMFSFITLNSIVTYYVLKQSLKPVVKALDEVSKSIDRFSERMDFAIDRFEKNVTKSLDEAIARHTNEMTKCITESFDRIINKMEEIEKRQANGQIVFKVEDVTPPERQLTKEVNNGKEED